MICIASGVSGNVHGTRVDEEYGTKTELHYPGNVHTSRAELREFSYQEIRVANDG